MSTERSLHEIKKDLDAARRLEKLFWQELEYLTSGTNLKVKNQLLQSAIEAYAAEYKEKSNE